MTQGVERINQVLESFQTTITELRGGIFDAETDIDLAEDDIMCAALKRDNLVDKAEQEYETAVAQADADYFVVEFLKEEQIKAAKEAIAQAERLVTRLESLLSKESLFEKFINWIKRVF